MVLVVRWLYTGGDVFMCQNGGFVPLRDSVDSELRFNMRATHSKHTALTRHI